MKRIVKTLAVLIALAVVAVASVIGYQQVQRTPAASKSPATTRPAADPIEVTVAPVRTGRVSRTIEVTGEVRPLKAVQVAPEVGGRLKRLRLADGTLIEEAVAVRRGDVVAVIDPVRYRAAVEAAESGVTVAQAALGRAEVTLADARREKERWTRLVADGAGTQRDLDQALTAFERAVAEVDYARAQVQQAEARRVVAQVDLDETTVEAPFDGVVTRTFVDEGAYVGPGTPLFALADLHAVEITAGVADRYYPRLVVGRTEASVEVDACPGERFSGRVCRIRPAMDQATRTVPVTIEVPNGDSHLTGGMYARVRLVLEQRDDVPVVPDAALVRTAGAVRAYVVEDGRIRVRPVTLGLTEGATCEVTDGLRPGERVVLRGQRLLSEGMAVRPIEKEPGR